jgi:hypothetical protein
VRISMDLGGVFHPGASDEDNALALQALLECLVVINRAFLRRYPGTRKLYTAGVKYGRTQVWDSIPDLITRRYGDCKSLTAMYVAEMRESHGDRAARPVFRFAKNPQTGQKDFHILVQQGKVFEDPSRKLGMDAYHRAKGLWLFPS